MIRASIFKALIVFYLLAVSGGTVASGQTTDCKPLSFNLAPTFETGGINTNAYTSGDFNLDGKLDLAAVNVQIRTISVMLGDGAGGFGPPRTFPTIINPWSITSGDMNNDGKRDIIIASGSENRFAILLNDGSGTFGEPIVITPPNEFPNQGEYYELKAADFNGDGNTDLAVVQNQSNKRLKMFLGDGQTNLTLVSTIPTTGLVLELALGNLNGDSYPDLVVAVSEPRGVNYVYGNAGGTFAFTPGFSIPNAFPAAMAIGNLNGDANADLIMAFGESMQAMLGDGAGGFTPSTPFSTLFFMPPSDVVTADFNGDGLDDVASTRNSPNFPGTLVQVLRNRGNGIFQDPVTHVTHTGATNLLANDLNGDTRIDIVTLQAAETSSGSKVGVMLNGSEGQFPVAKSVPWGATDLGAVDLNNDSLIDLVSTIDGSFGASEFTTALNDNNFGLLADTYIVGPPAHTAFDIGDVNDDGNADAVSVTSTGNTTPRLWTQFGDGAGNLGVPIAGSLWPSLIGNVAVGDLNGDGKDDALIVSGTTASPMLSVGDGSFTPVAGFSISPADPSIRPRLGDFNEDGKLDVVIMSPSAMTLWLGVGDGTFTQGTVQPFPMGYGSSAAGDFNGDGDLDVAILNGGNLSKYFGNGNGGFTSGVAHSVPGTASQVVAGDFNLDGLDDVAFISTSALGNLVIVPSTGQVPFSSSPVHYSVGGLGIQLVSSDFNSDGKTDIGYAIRFGSRGVIYNTTVPSTPCISINDVSVTEGDSGSVDAVFTVSLSAPSASTVRVNYSVSGQSATLGTDLQNVAGRLEIPAGEMSAMINVPIIGDELDEDNEQFAVILAGASNASISKRVGLGTIIDGDAEPSITISDVTAVEGNFTQFVFNVNLSGPSGRPISFRYTTADGTATAGSDYIAANNVLNIAPGVTTAAANVTIIGDSMHELNETFEVNLTEPVNVTFADSQAIGTINNDDPVPTLTIFGGGAPEGDSGSTNANVTLQLSNPTYLPVSVNVLTSDGTAIAGRDYVASDTPLIIPPASSSFSAPVQILGDVINEPNETFFVNIYNVSNATVNQTQSSVLIVDDDATQFDFDNDGKTDVGIFRPANGEWWYRRSLDSNVRVFHFGTASDRIVPADYTGDGRTDIAVWRPATGEWFVLRSENGTFYSAPFGTEGDVPVPGDFDNDGRSDVAVYRPSTSTWYISLSAGGTRIEQFGSFDDIPVAADYDGDGRTDPAIFRPSNGQWWLNRSTAGVIVAEFGNAADKLVPGDYTGDGKSDVAFWRPSTGEWFVLRSEDASFYSVPFGTTGDIPAPGDYDGDGKFDTTVFRPSSGTWYSQRSTAGTLIQQFGADGDRPVPNAFVP